MTALVSQLFIAMIPIDCKITNFSLHLYVKDIMVFKIIYQKICRVRKGLHSVRPHLVL